MSTGHAIFSSSRLMVFTLILLGLFSCQVIAYVPATATNSTDYAQQNGMNTTDTTSRLNIMWYNGSYSQAVSYQLIKTGTTGVSRGALVHFSEEKLNISVNATEGTRETYAPWIALISCDPSNYNDTHGDAELDVFTTVRDMGAAAAVLYSNYSATCVINHEYADPEGDYEKILDIYSVQSVASTRIIEYQFGQVSENSSLWKQYNTTQLTNHETDINNSISAGYSVAPGYLIGVLVAWNATEDPNLGNQSGGDPNTTSNSGGGNNTALAMIILYAITGCVSVLFCVVIITGAVRAIRHPERYGPRAASRWRHDGGQTRAQGLGRAILDTFPVVKFGRNTTHNQPPEDLERKVSSDVSLNEMHAISSNTPAPLLQSTHSDGRKVEEISSGVPSPTHNANDPSIREQTATPSSSVSDRAGTSQPQPRASRDDVQPDDMGTETCPICIVDFEEGDDLRVLPCDGKHRFHQACVDPWLLELSSSCPICRHDFLALENIIAGDSDDDDSSDEDEEDDERSEHPAQTLAPLSGDARRSRFSSYLNFARRRNSQRQQAQAAQASLNPSEDA